MCNLDNKVDPRFYFFGNYEVIGVEFLYLEAPDWELCTWIIKVAIEAASLCQGTEKLQTKVGYFILTDIISTAQTL